MKKWEYQIRLIENFSVIRREQELTELGADGWELIQVVEGNRIDYFYFKREAEELKDGWIPWGGGKNPAGNNLVIAEFRISTITKPAYSDPRAANEFNWLHTGNSYDIIAYRIVKE